MTITALNNSAQLLFTGLDDVEKIKSVTPLRGPLTDIWVEEATEIDRGDLKQLDKRLRGLSRHNKRVTLSFNPIDRAHWLYASFFGGWDDNKNCLDTPGLFILRTTYRDNAFLTSDDIAALEGETDPYFRSVYTCGHWGVTGERVFPDFTVTDLSDREKTEDRLLFGLDFGFASDPAAAVCCAYDKKRGEVLVFRELCEKDLTNDLLADRLRSFCRGAYITCDSAEPKSIAELRRLGIAALPAVKGPDSLTHGLRWLRGKKLILSPACPRLRMELSLYQWKKDRDGTLLSVPRGRDDHLIDALRYALEGEMNARYASAAPRPQAFL